MEKILCITDFYYPKPLANGICLEQIVEELKSRNNEVHVLCLGEKKAQKKIVHNGVKIYFVNKRIFYSLLEYGEENIEAIKGKIIYNLALLINRTSKLLLLPFYPMASFISIYSYYKKIKLLHAENNYDLMISTYCPFDGLIAGALVKKKYGEKLKYGIYLLDTLSNVGNSKWFSAKWMEKKGVKWEKRVFSYADFILYMRTHYIHHQKKVYEPYRKKMRVVDTPLFSRILTSQNSLKAENRVYKWIYAGAFYAGRREPNYVCKVITELNKNNNIKKNIIHFYSRGDCEETISNYQKNAQGTIVRHGYVDHSEVYNAIEKADVLVSVGNTNTEMVPSKIFEYMSTGKKMIHFYEADGDSCIPYLQNYPNVILVDVKKDFQININIINDFINQQIINVTYEEIEKIFFENTPSYTVNKIEEIIRLEEE